MGEGFQSWLSTMVGAACAVGEGSGAPFAAVVLGRYYPRLLEKGRFPAPGAVVDMAHLFVAGEDARFEPPARLSGGAAGGVRRYCAFLKGAVNRNGLHWTANHVGNLRAADAAGAGPDTAGLACFLETSTPLLPECGSPSDALRALKGWPKVVKADDLSSTVAHTGARKQVEEFFAGCERVAFEKYDDELSMLVVTAARVARGEAALNLPLLEVCLRYKPYDGSDPATRRRLRGSLKPRENVSSRSPEMGNHGITRKGSLSTVLRSLLAREDFEARLARHELLYFQRHAPKLEPRRVLVALIVECGMAMRTRPRDSRERRSSIALRIAARLLEDIVRTTAGIPSLELQPVVLLHNGESGRALRRRTLLLTGKEIDNLSKGGDEDKGWIPTWRHFLPAFFLNEPVWDDPSDKLREGDSAVTHCLLSLRPLAAGMSQIYSSSSSSYDLAFAVVLGDGSTTPHLEGDNGSGPSHLLRLLAPLATCSGLHLFRCAEEGLDWACFPPPPKRRRATTERFAYHCKDEDRVRGTIWEDLMERLVAL